MQRTLTPAISGSLIIIALAMCIAATFALPTQMCQTLQNGTCLPGPDKWNLAPLPDTLLNLLSIALCTLGVFLTNKTYNLIKGAQPFWSLFFMLLICANATINHCFSASTVVAPAVIAIVAAQMGLYRMRACTRQIFVCAAITSACTLFQQSFFLYSLAFLAAAAALKCLRLKETIAMAMGFIAPYWIAAPLSWAGICRLTPPHFQIISAAAITQSLFIPLVAAAAAILLATLLALRNSLHLYAGNSAVRCRNNAIDIYGIAAVAGLIVDFGNLQAYAAMASMWIALQLANALTLNKPPKPRLLVWLIAMVCVAVLTLSIIFQ